MHYIEIIHKSYKNHTEIIQKSHRNHACTQTHRIGRFRPQHVTLWAKTSVSSHYTLSQVPSALFPFPTHQIGRFRPQRVTLWVKTCVFDSWPGWELNNRPLVTLFAVVERQENGAMRTKNESSRPQSEKLWRKRANLDMSDM